MLSDEEKKEMLEDGRSVLRRQNFRVSKDKYAKDLSFEDYLTFLNSIQEFFSPFEISHRITRTKFNKL